MVTAEELPTVSTDDDCPTSDADDEASDAGMLLPEAGPEDGCTPLEEA